MRPIAYMNKHWLLKWEQECSEIKFCADTPWKCPASHKNLTGLTFFYFSVRLILLETSFLKINVISQSLFLALLTENVLQKYKFISL